MTRDELLESWRAAARSHGLQLPPRSTDITGTLDGRSLRVALQTTHRGRHCEVEALRARLSTAPLPHGVRIEPRSSMGHLRRILAPAPFKLYEPLLDDNLWITARDRVASRPVLEGEAFQDALRDFIVEGWSVDAAANRIVVVNAEPGLEPHALGRLRELLQALARALFTRSGPSVLSRAAQQVGLVAWEDRATGSVRGISVQMERAQGFIRVVVEVPQLIDCTVRRRPGEDKARPIGDFILDATVRVSSLDQARSKRLLTDPVLQQALLSLVHGRGAVVDGGRITALVRPALDVLLDVTRDAVTVAERARAVEAP